MNTSPFAMFIAALSLALTACGGGDGPTDGGNGGGAPFSASISGQAWRADELTFQVTGVGAQFPGSVIISGTQLQSAANYRSVVLQLSFIEGTGTYALGTNTGTTPGGIGSVVMVGGGSVSNYLTPLSGKAGTVTITTLTSSRMVGTFSFDAPPSLGGGSGVSVTGGSFDIELPTGFAVAAGNARGSTMSATMGGAPWNGAAIVAIGQVGSFSFNGATTERTVSITPTLPVQPGTYPIGTGGNGITVQVVNTGTIQSWGPAQGSQGSVTFTAVGGGRIAGSFAGVLAPVGGTAGTLTITDGEFDIRAP